MVYFFVQRGNPRRIVVRVTRKLPSPLEAKGHPEASEGDTREQGCKMGTLVNSSVTELVSMRGNCDVLVLCLLPVSPPG